MFELARHRVQKIAGSLLVVLPKRWVEKERLKKGDVVSCYLVKGGHLLIRRSKTDAAILLAEEKGEGDSS